MFIFIPGGDNRIAKFEYTFADDDGAENPEAINMEQILLFGYNEPLVVIDNTPNLSSQSPSNSVSVQLLLLGDTCSSPPKVNPGRSIFMLVFGPINVFGVKRYRIDTRRV